MGKETVACKSTVNISREDLKLLSPDDLLQLISLFPLLGISEVRLTCQCKGLVNNDTGKKELNGPCLKELLKKNAPDGADRIESCLHEETQVSK
ncbi:hypothetical protein M1403_04075 [Patescibacteria group bacterium]|nr:hypothetical protein [Patescibacteria group bacterium]